MIESIRRSGSTVFLEVNTRLVITEPVVHFSLNTGTEMSAELLRQHFYELRHKAKKSIARDCLMYLNKEEISALKSRLVKKWNGSKHCWK